MGKKANNPIPPKRSRRPGNAPKPGKGKRLANGASTARAHVRFLEAVLAGKLKECSWEALKALYFRGSTEQACVDKLASWARKHRIRLEVEQRRIGPTVANFVRFKPQRQG